MGDYERRSEQEADERRRREEAQARQDRLQAELDESKRQAAQDAEDRARADNIMRLGMKMIEAFLEGRAHIEVLQPPPEPGEIGKAMHAAAGRTIIRLRMDPTDAA